MYVLLLSSLAESHLYPSSFQGVFAGAGVEIKQDFFRGKIFPGPLETQKEGGDGSQRVELSDLKKSHFQAGRRC